MLIRLSVACLGLWALIFLAWQGSGGSEKIVFADTPFPPYVVGVEGGQATGGLAVEIAKAVFGRLGMEVTVELVPWQRALKMAETGKADGITLLMRTEEREKFMAFSQELFAATESLFFRHDRLGDFKWRDFSDLKPYHIGLVRGYTYGEDFLRAVSQLGLQVEYTASSEQNLKKLVAGRVDLVVEEEMVAGQFIRQHPDWRSLVGRAAKPVTVYPYYIGLSRRSGAAKLAPKVDEVIAELKRDGALEKILDRQP